jgi:hypothetical protein
MTTQKTTQNTCSDTIHGDWRTTPCRNPAKVEMDGSWVCGIHARARRLNIESAQRYEDNAARAEQAFADRKRIKDSFQELLAVAEAALAETRPRLGQDPNQPAAWQGGVYAIVSDETVDALMAAIAKAKGVTN